MRSHLIMGAIAALLWLSTSPGALWAQSDAEMALNNARTAFANEQFETARDLLKTAGQTDADNPDVFLLLGKAHYQLGEVDQAIAAWKRTLKLAPTQAYARRMVDVLQGKIVDTDLRIEVITSLLEDGLAQLALSEIMSIKRDALADGQLVQLLSLEADALIDLGQGIGALKPLRELAIRDPAQAATARNRLLLGKAKLIAGDQWVAEGLAILSAVKTEFADTDEAKAADLALLSFRIDQGEGSVDELAAWINANPQHPDLATARQTMIRAASVYLQVAAQQPNPGKDEPLSEADKIAFAAAEKALASLLRSAESLELSRQIVAHIQNRFITTGAYGLADETLQRLLKLELPPSSRTVLEIALAKSQDAAAAEQLDRILTSLQDGDEVPETLATWIGAHQKHPRLLDARRRLVTAYLQQTLRAGAVDADAELAPSDQAAIAAAGVLLESLTTSAEKSKLVSELLNHLITHYSAGGAHAAAITGQQSILALILPRPARLLALNALVDTQASLAVSRMDRAVSAGTPLAGALPADVVALLKTLGTINAEFPAQPAWRKQADIGAQVLSLGQRIEWPAKVTQIKTTDAWALEIVLPVIVVNPDAQTTTTAIGVVNSIVEAIAAVKQKSAFGLAAATQQRLLAALPQDHELWPQAVMRQLNLRIADDAVAFNENASAGREQLNAALSEEHKATLALASQLIERRPSQAAAVLATLQPFLSRRSAAGFGAAVDEAYTLLSGNLPPAQLRIVSLAAAESWVNRVIADHTRLLGNGFQPPQALDPQLEKALVQCYQLQAELDRNDEFVKRVRAVRATVIGHYRNLHYHEAAAAAIQVAAEQRVAWLDALAEFELAGLSLSKALDELAEQTKQFQGRQNITLTPAIKAAIAGFEKFITDRPTDLLVAAAVTRILSVGNKYEQYKKYEIAAEIYTNLETFAAASESLQQAPPGTATVAQRAAQAAAMALHVKATDALVKLTASQPEGTDPPAELSQEFQAAFAAYQAILTKYPDSPLVSSAIGKLMEIAGQYAGVGAWDVAENVYAKLQQQQLPLREPERLDLARALCEIGKVMPAHAQQMLAVITLWERSAASGPDIGDQIAMIDAGMLDNIPGEGAGFGGGAGFNDADEEMMAMGGLADQPMGEAASAQPLSSDPFAAEPAQPPANEQADEFRADVARAARQQDLLAAVRKQQSAMATQIALMRDKEIQHLETAEQPVAQQQAQQPQAEIAAPVLSEAEIERRETILDVAYTKLQAIRNTYAQSTSARQARGEIMVIVNHWRSIKQWQRSAALVKRFLEDNPTDIQLPNLRHEVARDYLAWAAAAVKPDAPKQELLDEVNRRFTLARDELARIIAAFPENQSLIHQAQWDIAGSHLSQARVVAGFSSTLARGQFVRAANELLKTADLYHDHPQINELPQMLANIAQELTSRQFFDEAITVWNEMTLHYPGHPLAEQAALQIAQTYQHQLRLPLRAVESYLELNFARGGSDVTFQDAIFQIAAQLKNEQRWVEALHVLETFVDSFPNHASAGQALTMIGQVHQTNEVWEDAIAAYRRVILEYDQGDWAQQSKWSIAECTINLSRWEEAQGAYREYQKAYPEDPKVAEATKRLEILKDLARYQKVVDEEGQRKAFDAQYQIASIVRTQLANPVKAIIEYKKVAERWPESHLADDALFQVGMIYMQLKQTENAREAFFATAQQYPTSPLADDALFQVGASFEEEAQTLAGVTRGTAVKIAAEQAQRQAYGFRKTTVGYAASKTWIRSLSSRKLARAKNWIKRPLCRQP